MQLLNLTQKEKHEGLKLLIKVFFSFFFRYNMVDKGKVIKNIDLLLLLHKNFVV
jgi:hypothetical protein